MGGLLHLVQLEGPGRAGAPASPLLAVPNVTAHPSTSSVPASYFSMWHYNCLCTLKSYMQAQHYLPTGGEALFFLSPVFVTFFVMNITSNFRVLLFKNWHVSTRRMDFYTKCSTHDLKTDVALCTQNFI